MKKKDNIVNQIKEKSSCLRKLVNGVFALILVWSICSDALGQKGWRDIVSAEDLYESYPEMITQLFKDIDLDYPGLEQVKQEVNDGKMVEACNALLTYFANNSHAQFLLMQQPEPTNKVDATADTTLNNVFINIYSPK